MDRHIVRASLFTISRTFLADFSLLSGQELVKRHSFLFSSLSGKIGVIAHDGVDRDLVGTGRLTEAAGVAAVKLTASLAIEFQSGLL